MNQKLTILIEATFICRHCYILDEVTFLDFRNEDETLGMSSLIKAIRGPGGDKVVSDK